METSWVAEFRQYLNSTLQCIFYVEFSTNFRSVNSNNSLITTFITFTLSRMQCQDVEPIQNMLISKERELCLMMHNIVSLNKVNNNMHMKHFLKSLILYTKLQK